MAAESPIAVILVLVVVCSPGTSVLTVGTQPTSSSPTEISSCKEITEPGRYKLTQNLDLNGTPDSRTRDHCLGISANNVVIDGNGHMITDRDEVSFAGNPYGGAIGVDPFQRPELSNITIENLQTHDSLSVSVVASNTTIRNVTLQSPDPILITPSSFKGQLDISGADLLIENVTVPNGSVAVTASGGAAIRNNTARGFSLNDVQNAELTNNTATGNPDQEFPDRGTAIAELESGFELVGTSSTFIANNTARNHSGDGFRINTNSRDNVFRDNVAAGNEWYGVSIEEDEDLTASAPDSTTESTTFVNTTAVDNDAGAALVTRPGSTFENLRIAENTAVSLRGQGFIVRGVDERSVTPPSGTPVGDYVTLAPASNETTWEDSWAFLNVSYDESRLESTRATESEIRLFRRGTLFVPLVPDPSTGDSQWREVSDETGVNAEENYVYANVTPIQSPNLDQLPNENETTALPAGDSVEGILDTGEDRWYTLNATAGEQIGVVLSGEDPNEYAATQIRRILGGEARNEYDPITLRLYGPDGTLRAVDHPDDPNDNVLHLRTVGQDEDLTRIVYEQQLTEPVQEAGTYYLRLSSQLPTPADRSLNYTVTRVPGTDLHEPNDDLATATRVETEELVMGRLDGNDVDWYAFDAEAGEAILPTLSMVGSLENRSMAFSIVGPDGDSISASPNDLIHGNDYETGVEWPGQGRRASGAATAEVNGTYYVGVFAGDSNAAMEPGAYALTVEIQELDPFDPNQHRETATSIETGTRVNGTASAYDEDWFTFEADAGERITINVETWADDPLAVSVYDPDGELLAERDYFFGWNWNTTANQTGQYYVQFHQSEINWNLLEQWTYNLTVRTTGEERSIDTDGLSNSEEANTYGTDPTVTDTDGDGWSDLSETNRACDPLSHP